MRRFNIRFSLPGEELGDITQIEGNFIGDDDTNFQMPLDEPLVGDEPLLEEEPVEEDDLLQEEVAPSEDEAGSEVGSLEAERSEQRSLPLPLPTPIQDPLQMEAQSFARQSSLVNVRDRSASVAASAQGLGPTRKKKEPNFSKYGTLVPSLPAGVVKKLANQFARISGGSKSKLAKEALVAIEEASDWFFEQVSGDLEAYSKHAGRKTIDEADMITLMKRSVLFANTN